MEKKKKGIVNVDTKSIKKTEEKDLTKLMLCSDGLSREIYMASVEELKEKYRNYIIRYEQREI